jgi:hypothetical protein
MSKQLVDMVLPRLARRLHAQLKRFRQGRMSENEFADGFASLLQKQYMWLAKKGVSEPEAALTIHSAVLVLSKPGLRAAATEAGQPLEVLEFQAVRSAATDLSEHYCMDHGDAYNAISEIVALYGE